MLLSVVSVLVVAQSNSEVPEGLMNNPVLCRIHVSITTKRVGLAPKIVIDLLNTHIDYQHLCCDDRPVKFIHLFQFKCRYYK